MLAQCSLVVINSSADAYNCHLVVNGLLVVGETLHAGKHLVTIWTLKPLTWIGGTHFRAPRNPGIKLLF